MVTVFLDMPMFLFSFLVNIFSTALAVPADCTEGSSLVSEIFSVFYVPFPQFPTVITSTFFLKFAIYLVLPEVLFHFRCFNPQVVDLLSTKWL